MTGIETTWWLTPFLIVTWIVTLTAFDIALFPRRMNGPIFEREQRTRRNPRRTLLVLVGPGLLLVGTLVATFGPRLPAVVTLDPEAPAEDEAPIYSSTSRLEAALDSVLDRARCQYPGMWQGRTAEQCDRLRAMCLDELLGNDAPELGSTAPADPLPTWVVESARMSLLDGEMTRTGATRAWVAISAGHNAWDRLKRVRIPTRILEIREMSPRATGDSTVFALFDGSVSPSSGEVRAQALIRGTPGTPGAHEMAITVAGATIDRVSIKHHQVAEIDRVPIAHTLPSPPVGSVVRLHDARVESGRRCGR